jgi:hypothetical protein
MATTTLAAIASGRIALERTLTDDRANAPESVDTFPRVVTGDQFPVFNFEF